MKADSAVKQACTESRAWTLSLFTGLAREAKVTDADALGRQLQMVYDGAAASADVDRNRGAAATAGTALAFDAASKA